MFTPQLPLGLEVREDATFANFHAAGNQTLIDVLSALPASVETFFYLWGAPGSGRTHLLQACCIQASSQQCPVVYLDLAKHSQYQPEMLEGLEVMVVIGLDNIDAIAGNAAWEEAVFHLYNRVRECGTNLIIAGDAAPANLAIALPDLKSRLAWGIVFHLELLSDDEKLDVLKQRALARGLSLTDDVARFIINRCARGMDQLFEVLNQLDIASLSAQRKITIPFIKMVLGL